MVWFFERSDGKMEVETRFDNDTFEYVIVVRKPEGRERAEAYADAGSFRSRLVALEQELLADRWHNTGPPLLLPAGWPQKRPLR